MRKVFALGTCLLALTGCAASGSCKGWHPKDKWEMEQLIGETTIQALSQFFMQAQNPHKHGLNKQLTNPPDERL